MESQEDIREEQIEENHSDQPIPELFQIVEKIVNERLEPYLNRIQQLELHEKLKDSEITTLKLAIERLNTMYEELKKSSGKPSTSARGQNNQSMSRATTNTTSKSNLQTPSNKRLKTEEEIKEEKVRPPTHARRTTEINRIKQPILEEKKIEDKRIEKKNGVPVTTKPVKKEPKEELKELKELKEIKEFKEIKEPEKRAQTARKDTKQNAQDKKAKNPIQHEEKVIKKRKTTIIVQEDKNFNDINDYSLYQTNQTINETQQNGEIEFHSTQENDNQNSDDNQNIVIKKTETENQITEEDNNQLENILVQMV